MAEEQPAKKRRKGRSPSYPGLDLRAALEKAQTFYRHEQHHAAPVETLLHHWGYAPKSGTGLVALAALKKFGLIEDEGRGDERKAKLTPRALDIIHDEREGSPEREAAIKDAALEPKIHRELFDKYQGGLPSDQSLRFHLIRERSFTNNGADEFIGELKATLIFAGLSKSDILSDEEEDKDPLGGKTEDGMSAAASPVFEGREDASTKDFQFTVTLYGGRLATVKAPVPMSKQNLERLKRMIADQLEPFIEGDGTEPRE